MMNWRKDLSYLEAFWKGGCTLVQAYPEVAFPLIIVLAILAVL